jgi:hypothetical protein
MVTHAENLKQEKLQAAEDKKQKKNMVMVNGKYVKKGQASNAMTVSAKDTPCASGKVAKVEAMGMHFLEKELGPVVQQFRWVGNG